MEKREGCNRKLNLAIKFVEGQVNSLKPHSLAGLQVHKEEFYIIFVVGCKLLVRWERRVNLGIETEGIA